MATIQEALRLLPTARSVLGSVSRTGITASGLPHADRALRARGDKSFPQPHGSPEVDLVLEPSV